ncbi:hypothetical protein BD410DRAFT_831194 [Rickenella mellea]|uniref:F-box domain-containing protein n=1 Tax=Rickenella mellea TaxID=50990 RepID=A0A4Y7PS87_9AGAM|nr:hypothetical protein BD410DRAFT_831194 [Rickenella mellea]
MAPHVPPEIWRHIFRCATFTATSLNMMDWHPHWPYASPPWEVDQALTYFSTQPTKMALTLVSRHFREMTLEFLFELVQLHYTRNAQLLLDSILPHTTGTDTRSSPAKWIKYIIVDLDGVSASDSDQWSMVEVLTKIFPCCSNLAAFGWSSVRLNGKHDHPTLMASIPLTITTLEWHADSCMESFYHLRYHTALQNLRVCRIISMSREGLDVTIPFITHLSVRNPLGFIAEAWWDLPSVSHLTIHNVNYNLIKQLLSKSRDTIRSIYLPEPLMCKSGDFPRLLASMPNLETLSYAIILNMSNQLHFSSLWSGVSRHASLTRIYIFAGIGIIDKWTLSTIRDFFRFHLQPLMASHLLPLTISIIGISASASHFFKAGEFWEDGCHTQAGGKRKFCDELSASLSSPQIQCFVE